MKASTKVYVGLGGNIGDSLMILNQALKEIENLPEVTELNCSSFYRTSPVGDQTLDPFINAVCCFQTTFTPNQLLKKLQIIETKLGKIPKPKYAPRSIDIDILFYGNTCYSDSELEIPHPHWQERLFVLIPLADLTTKIELMIKDSKQIFILNELIQLLNPIYQVVSLVEKNFYLH